MALPVDIETLLGKGVIEDDRIEFKKGWNPEKIYRSICAFANDIENIGGGYILVGVNEDGTGRPIRPVYGVPEDSFDRIQKEMIGFDNLFKPYYMTRHSIEDVDEKKVLAIWVPAGTDRPYSIPSDVNAKHKDYKFYIRNGSNSIEAKGEALEELRNLANRTPFDDRGNPAIKLEDISPLLLQEHLRKVGSSLAKEVAADNVEDILDQLNLLEGPVENRRIRNVAAMMFCEEPAKFFPYLQVDIVIFPEGRLKDPNQMIEVPTIKGTIPQMIDKTLEYLRTNIIKEHIIKQKFNEHSLHIFNYPYQALEEAVVNAFYHRSHQEHEPITITIEPEGIEINTVSGPDRSISDAAIKKAQLLKSKRYRNRRLGDFLKERGLSEGRFTGFPTIQEELSRNGSKPAVVETMTTARISPSLLLVERATRRIC